MRRSSAASSLLAMPTIVVADRDLLLRTIEVYESQRLDFAEAYLVVSAEPTGFLRVASFDRSIHRASTVERLEPARPLVGQ